MQREKKSHLFRTVQQKLEILEYRRQHGKKKAARMYDCTPSNIRDWEKNEKLLRECSGKKKRRSLHKGKKTKYPEIEPELYAWIISKRSKGKQVTTALLLQKIKAMDTELSKCSDEAIKSFLRRFMSRYLLAYRKPTHVGQELPPNFMSKIAEFREKLLSMKAGLHASSDRIVNMDETAVYFEPVASKVVDVKGKKSIPVSQMKAGQKRSTLVLAITEEGNKLPPLIIFKGHFGKTVQKRLQLLDAVKAKRVYAICDNKAWNSSKAMQYWLDNIWNSHSRNMQNNILIMDDYSVHKTSSVNTRLNACKTFPLIIPGGLTRFLQPLDIGVNNLIKAEMRKNIYGMLSTQRVPSLWKKLERISLFQQTAFGTDHNQLSLLKRQRNVLSKL
eukprot:TRINITY_DN50229_c0_g1_i6.p1 TRINITY_DN50229_c0_g1~~TRINITY_DN50229_c0_g1_i6.p1  ORF type:complete len:388 (+),score=27.35 TRINITY_DN50229_c0_g1_i6:542-1705(+)